MLFFLPPIFLTWTFLTFDEEGSRVLRVGYSLEAPYAFVDSKGRITGEAPEIARVVSERLGYEIQWRQYGFSALIPALLLNQIDVIASGMFITEERLERMLFSIPTYTAPTGFLAAKGVEAPRSFLELLGKESLVISVLAGSVELDFLLDAGFPEERILQVLDTYSGTRSVANGSSSVFILTLPSVRWIAQNNKDYDFQVQAAQGGFPTGRGAFGFSLKSEKLRDQWNSVLAGYLGSEDHKSLIRRFGFSGERPLPRVYQ